MSARIPPPPSPTQSSPTRRCIVCREPAPRHDLLRVVRRPDDGIALSSSEDGRGAYVHHEPLCLAVASAQPRYLARALRRPPPDDLLDQLRQLAEARST